MTRAGPRQYCGADPTRRRRVGRAHEVRIHDCDTSGLLTYRFNEHGYRGASFAPAARRRICIFGEEHAIGVGLPEAASWPHLVADAWRRSQGWAAEDVCVLNFAESGASNRTIAGEVLAQCERLHPDLVLVHFADHTRAEIMAGDRPLTAGPRLIAALRDRRAARELGAVTPEQRGLRSDLLRRARAWVASRHDVQDALASQRDILQVQFYLRARGIQAVAVCNRLADLRELSSSCGDSARNGVDLLDASFLLDVDIRAAAPSADLAADGMHPGPRRHAAFAASVWDRLQRSGIVPDSSVGVVGGTAGAGSVLALPSYDGDSRVRLLRVGGAWHTDRFGADQSGRCNYRFNTLGYRGREYDPRSRPRIFVFGESNAFGTGLDETAPWPMQYARLWSEATGHDPEGAMVVNFAEAGGSNEMIARTLLTRCTQVRPDLVLVDFASLLRSELPFRDHVARVGPWLATADVPPSTPADRRDAIEAGRRWLQHHCVVSRAHRSLQAILTVQYFLRARRLPAAACIEGWDKLVDAVGDGPPSLAALLALVDRDLVQDASVFRVEPIGEAAADGVHCSARRHRTFARTLFEARSAAVRATQIETR
ncbi:MAG: hypothetical protein IPM29_31900 [Planctomycetes bacterium]|nr:hypothetical protein [Planctomycetota bacterium]